MRGLDIGANSPNSLFCLGASEGGPEFLDRERMLPQPSGAGNVEKECLNAALDGRIGVASAA
jgi:hypothetical protein